MLNPLFSIPMGLIFGFLAGLGVGGGSLLILWLSIVGGMAHNIARAVNLMFFIAAAGSVSIFRWRKGDLQLKTVVPAVIGGCIAAGLCSWFGSQVDQRIIRKIFGVLLLVTGIWELCYRPRKAK